MDKSGTGCSRKVVSGKRVAGAVRSLVYATGLHETLLTPVFMYGSETMIWKEKKRSWIRSIQMYNLRGLLVSGGW